MTYFLRGCLVLAACTLTRPTVGQQAPDRTTFVGMLAGAGMAFTSSSPGYLDLNGAHLQDANGTGHILTLGAFVRVERGAWSAQPELRYQNVYSAPFTSSRGGGSGFGSFFSGPVRDRFHVRQLTVGALGGHRFGPQQELYWLLGPALAWRLGTDDEPLPTSSGKNASLPYAMDQAPAAMQLQLHGALGHWGRHFGAEARFIYGLTPLVRYITVQEQQYDFQVGGGLFLLSVGYRFGEAN